MSAPKPALNRQAPSRSGPTGSATLHLRLPRDLHDELRVRAEEQEVSLNALVTAMVAGSIQWELGPRGKQRRLPKTESWLPEEERP